jgi:hypothetical protein
MKILSALMVLLSLALAQRISEISQADQEAIQSVISGQLVAFQKGDASTAYSFAAPGVKQGFPNPQVFVQMVKAGYLPLYSPKSVEFGRVELYQGTPVQQLTVVGPDDKTYLALYVMQKQPDGNWKIAGVSLELAPAAPKTGA